MDLELDTVTLKPGLGVTQGHRNRHIDPPPMISYFDSNHRPISYHFRDKWRFQSKISIFSHPVHFAPMLKGFPWIWASVLEIRKLEWWGYRAENEVWRYLQLSGYNPPTWQTYRDRWTDTGRQQRPRLRIASRGNKIICAYNTLLNIKLSNLQLVVLNITKHTRMACWLIQYSCKESKVTRPAVGHHSLALIGRWLSLIAYVDKIWALYEWMKKWSGNQGP